MPLPSQGRSKRKDVSSWEALKHEEAKTRRRVWESGRVGKSRESGSRGVGGRSLRSPPFVSSCLRVFVPSWLFVSSWLEEELQPELHDAWILRRGDTAECRCRIHRGVGVVEVDGV